MRRRKLARMTNTIAGLPSVQLGRSDLRVTPICLGTMTFGEQVGELASHALLDHSLALGVNRSD